MPIIQIEDSAGTPVPMAGILISVSQVAGPTAVGVAPSTDASGQTTLTSLAVLGIVGQRLRIRFHATNLNVADAISDPIAVSNGVYELVMVAQPPTIAAFGGAMSSAPTVQLFDNHGFASATAGVSISVSSDSSAGLSGTLTSATDNQGMAQFSNVAFNAVGKHALVFKAPGYASTTSDTVTVLSQGSAPSWHATSMGVGKQRACGLTASGAAACWGDYVTYLPLIDSVANPVAVGGGLTFVSISVGRYHACGLTAAGAAYCWGSNGYGQLGANVGNSAVETPLPVVGGLTFVSLSSGDYNTCGITPAGAAYCWGINVGGELGDGTRTFRGTPSPVFGGHTFTAIALGQQHSCGLVGGVAWCWGSQTVGRHVTPQLVGGSGLVRIVSGGLRDCALDSAGHAACWSWYNFGTPPTLTGPTYDQISTSDSTTCTVAAGVAECGGQPVPGGLTFSAVYTSGGSNALTCGLTTSNEVYCWGKGALGDGGFSTNPNPVRVVAGPQSP